MCLHFGASAFDGAWGKGGGGGGHHVFCHSADNFLLMKGILYCLKVTCGVTLLLFMSIINIIIHYYS